MVQKAVDDPAVYATGFCYAGTYWDYVHEIAREHDDIKQLVNLNISDDEIISLLTEAGFKGYRLDMDPRSY